MCVPPYIHEAIMKHYEEMNKTDLAKLQRASMDHQKNMRKERIEAITKKRFSENQESFWNLSLKKVLECTCTIL